MKSVIYPFTNNKFNVLPREPVRIFDSFVVVSSRCTIFQAHNNILHLQLQHILGYFNYKILFFVVKKLGAPFQPVLDTIFPKFTG